MNFGFSEWTDCKELPRKIHLTTTPTTTTTTTITIPNIGVITSTLHSESTQFTHHIIPLFQNHPHLSNLFPNSLLSPIMNVTTTAASSFITPVVDFHASNKSGIETLSSAINKSSLLYDIVIIIITVIIC